MKPVPVPDLSSQPFFDGALAGRLMLRRCPRCGTFQSPSAYIAVPARPRCLRCLAAPLDWVAASGRASLYSFAVVHQSSDEAFAADLPYNLAVVETEEGVRLSSQVVDCPIDKLAIGMALEVVFERCGDDVALPKFRPRR